MFDYYNKTLHVEGVSLRSLADKAGTPLYVYSRTKIIENFSNFDKAFSKFPHLICFAMKANSNLSIIRTLAKEGAGTDIVSGGELYRALKAGVSPKKIVFSGVGKTREEMRYALRSGILMFNVESVEELEALNDVAEDMDRKAPIALRVNPDVEADTHHHITTGKAENKFGIHKSIIIDVYRKASALRNISVLGLQAHIGSQITAVKPFETLIGVLLDMVDKLRHQGIALQYLDMGGGLGITYNKEAPPSPFRLAEALEPHLRGRDITLLFEPGRFLVGEAGALITKVLYRKKSGHKTFVIVDAAMNDLARPALYDAYHEIVPVAQHRGRSKEVVDVVGPICESGDYLARARTIEFPEQGDLLAVKGAGAYGFAMSSQYNSRPRAAEILVSGKKWQVVRKRETLEDITRGER